MRRRWYISRHSLGPAQARSILYTCMRIGMCAAMAFSAANVSSLLPFLAVFIQCCWGQRLNDIILGNEATVNALAVSALAAFNRRCSMPMIAACSSPQAGPFSGCAVAACGSLIGSATSLICTEDFGVVTLQADGCERNCTGGRRRLDNANSVIRTATATSVSDGEVVTEECWTRDLNTDFVANRIADTRTLRWQQIGTPTGFYRIYPGVPQQTCYSYDPRNRPWYVAATSGPKDVILVIDVSGSMSSNNRIGLAREAAITVINTLTNSDYVAVVLFNSDATQLLLAGQTRGALIQATNENIVRLSERVATIQPSGNTNFEAAFGMAFSIVDGATELTSNCQTAILFLTDGIPTVGRTSTQLEDRVRSLNRNPDGTLKATLFTFTLGSGTERTLPFAFACQNQGIFTHVDDGGNLREQMSQYYEYYATLRQSDSERVVWVEPYIDASGAGLLVTASRAVYDRSTTPPRLIGVVAVDTLVSDLRDAGIRAGVDFAGVIRALALRNTCPPFSLSNLTESELNTFRVTHGGEACGSSRGNEPESTACTIGASSLNYCFYRDRRYDNDLATYQNEACCRGSGLSECGAVHIAVSSGVLLLGVLSFILTVIIT